MKNILNVFVKLRLLLRESLCNNQIVDSFKKSKYSLKNVVIMKFSFVFFLFVFSNILIGQSAHEYRQLADQLYDNLKYNDAEEAYRKSLELENTAKAKYNLGNSLFEQERFEEAASQYESAAQSGVSEGLRSDSYFNLGNSMFKQEKYDESVKAYKNALKIAPSDMDYKRNLKLAQKMLKVQQQQEKQEQKESDDQEKKDDDKENKDQEKQDQEQQDKEEKDKKDKEEKDKEQEEKDKKEQEEKDKEEDKDKEDEGKDDPKDQEKEGQEGEEKDKKDLSKEDARRLLEIMDQEDKKVQQKLRKASSRKNKSSKTW